MITVTQIIGTASDPRCSEKLHDLSHHGSIEYLVIERPDLQRRRLRGRTDKGTDVALALGRDQQLTDGSVLLLEQDRAILVRASEERWLEIQPLGVEAALAVGYFIGNLHWRVRFGTGAIAVVLEGPREDYVSRLQPFVASKRAKIIDHD